MAKQNKTAGLRGLSAGETAISTVDKQGTGLSYYGYDIEQLAQYASFEEVAYLLLYAELPTHTQLNEFIHRLKQARSLPETLKQVLEKIPAESHPMDVMRTACSILGTLEPELNFKQQTQIAERLLAIFPSIMCYWYCFNKTGKRINITYSHNSIAQHILQMLYGKPPNTLQQKAMDVSLILYAEHEFNASTFTARICASTLSDFYSAICAAIGSLRGPLHGGANEGSLHLFSSCKNSEQVIAKVKDKLQKKEKIMGFGHAVYKKSDPRNALIKHWARKLSEQAKDEHYFVMAEAIEALMQQQKNLFANLDFYSALNYHFLDIPASLFTPLFVCSRITGWSAHIMEQRKHNVLIRPIADYTGVAPRNYIPVEQRLV